jgi:hypothetical protein
MMRDVEGMRTTVNLDDDVLRAAKELAVLSGRTLGQVISDLSRAALEATGGEDELRNGVPLLPSSPDSRLVTSEDVARMLDEG